MGQQSLMLQDMLTSGIKQYPDFDAEIDKHPIKKRSQEHETSNVIRITHCYPNYCWLC